jgi:lipopolysaccharide export system permease protein
VLPFLAVPFALGRRRNQRAYRFGLALIVLIGYYEIIEQGAIASRSNGISPWLTMWLPFAAITLYAGWRFWQSCFVLGIDHLDPVFDRLARAGTAVKRLVFRNIPAREQP